MKRKPTVSLVMGTYNALPYVKKSVTSILNQTFKDIEFVIVDDASTDGTWKYLTNLKDARLKLLKNSKNVGLAASLNKALAVTRGKYIARMDADDISLPSRLQIQFEYLEKNKKIDACGTWANLIDEKGKKIGVKKYPTSGEQIKRSLKWFSPLIHPTIMAKAEFFEKLNGYRSEYDYAEDYDLLVRAIPNFTVANLPRVLLNWRLEDKRRSRVSMNKINKADLKVKIDILKNNYFGRTYFVYVLLKILTTYLVPTKIKLVLSTHFKLS